jgi:hypothetical protein
MEKQRRDGTTFLDANREHLERSKIRISARQWVAERILAKAPRMSQDGAGGGARSPYGRRGPGMTQAGL